MNREELLAAVLAERRDYRWFATPLKPAIQPGDDEVTTARRRRLSVDSDMGSGRWVQRNGVQHWEVSA